MTYSNITLGDLRNALTYRVGGNSVFWTNAEKNNAINEALRVWTLATGEVTDSNTVTIVDNQSVYATPSPIAFIDRVILGTSNTSTPLTLTSVEALDLSNPNWMNESASTPAFWYPVGPYQFGIYPVTLNATYPTITVYGILNHQDLTADGDYMQVPNAAADAILDYAHHYLTFKEGGTELEATKPLLQNFFKAVGQRNSEFLATSAYKKFTGMDANRNIRPFSSQTKAAGAR